MEFLKAQSSMEFFLLVGLAFLATILFVGLSANEIKEFRDTKEFLIIKDLALKLQKEVSIAATVEEGYERSFDLPERLENNVDYFTTMRNNTLTVNSSKAVITVAVSNVTGDFTKGTNTIKNTGGRVFVN